MISLGSLILTANVAFSSFPYRETEHDGEGCITETVERNIFHSPHAQAKSSTNKGDILFELEQCRLMHLGWDGHEATPPNPGSIQDARTFILAIPSKLLPPRVSTSRLGKVGVYWEDSETFIDVLFNGDGVYSYYGKNPGGEIFGDKVAVSYAHLPDKLLAMIGTMVNG